MTVVAMLNAPGFPALLRSLRERDRERAKSHARQDWPAKARCEVPTLRGGECPYMGYYDPALGCFACGHHGDR